MKKQIIYREEARQKLLAGVEKLSEAVRLTLGAKGRNVIIKQRYGAPMITNDGVTIAKETVLEDEFENLGAEIVKEVASRTNDSAGDGTTTATILCHAIFKEGLKFISQGANAMSVKDGINNATKLVVEDLKRQAIKIDTREQKEQVATISSQDKEVGKIVADMLEEIGDDGIITVEEGNKNNIETEVVKGMKLSAGWYTPHFMTDPAKGKAEYNDVAVLVTDCKMAFTLDLKPFLDKLIIAGKKELVILSFNPLEGQMLVDLINNKLKGNFSTLFIQVPGFGQRKKDLLEDLALALGAKYVSTELGMSLEGVTVGDLGSIQKIVAERDKTIIITGNTSDKVKDRLDSLKNEMSKNESEYEKEKIKERIARLNGGVGVIRVGALTDSEQAHRLHRVEDAVEATKSAIEEGIIQGGGVALVLASSCLDNLPEDADERIGFEILKKALLVPARQIAENAGRDGGEIVAEIRRSGLGYDVQKNSFVNMIESGIIDPVKVTRSALENAASAASILLTTEAAITHEDEK